MNGCLSSVGKCFPTGVRIVTTNSRFIYVHGRQANQNVAFPLRMTMAVMRNIAAMAINMIQYT